MFIRILGNRTAVTELGGRTVNYTYDDLYRLTNETIANDTHGINGTVTYGYDAVGNRLVRTSSVAGVPTQTSTFDANDRLNSDTYDANGNTKVSTGGSYDYDFENRLITHISSITSGFVYDGDGNRVARTANGVTTNYLVDNNNHTGYAQVVEELQRLLSLTVHSPALSTMPSANRQRRLINSAVVRSSPTTTWAGSRAPNIPTRRTTRLLTMRKGGA